MKARVCPFCDLVSDEPHHTQQACIDALQKEIAQTRKILARRAQPVIAGGPTGPGQYRLPAEATMPGAPRMSLRCVTQDSPAG
jgi:hypothetical protein